MNKYRQLVQRTVKLAMVAFAIVGVVGAVFAGVSMYAADTEKQKTDAESKLNSDKSTLTTLREQLNKSGAAEKRYAEFMQGRNGDVFSGQRDDLSVWIRSARDRYRLKMGASNQGAEAKSERPELLNFPYDVTVRSQISMDLQAISDTHIYSFLDDMMRSAPGLVRIESITLKRIAEMTDASIENLRSGSSTPLLVDAKIEFSLIGLQPKPTEAGKPEAQGN